MFAEGKTEVLYHGQLTELIFAVIQFNTTVLGLVWAWPASPNEMESLGTATHCIRNRCRNPAELTPT